MNNIMEAADQLIAELRRLTAENAELRAKVEAQKPEPAKFELPKDKNDLAMAMLHAYHAGRVGTYRPGVEQLREAAYALEFAKAFAMEAFTEWFGHKPTAEGAVEKLVAKLAERYEK